MFRNWFKQSRAALANDSSAQEFVLGQAPHSMGFTRGEGCYLWDANQTRYLDVYAADGGILLGHSHSKLSQALSLQSAQLICSGGAFENALQAQLSQRFCDLASMQQVSFVQTRDQAIELALQVICADQRKSASTTVLSTCLLKSSVVKIEPLSLNNIDQIGAQTSNQNVVAVWIEAISSDGRFTVAEHDYLIGVRELCSEHNWLMVVDESRTAMGRCGDWFHYHQHGYLPDLVIAADSLAGGLPLAACAVADKPSTQPQIDVVYAPGELACRSALSLLSEIEKEQLNRAAEETGEYLKRQLLHRLGALESVAAIRGIGLLLAIELKQPNPELAKSLLDEGLVVGVNSSRDILVLTPALIFNQDQVLETAVVISRVLGNL